MKKLIFETKDFINKSNLDYDHGVIAKDLAQAKHNAFMKELLDGAKVVHGYVDEWSHRDFSTLWLNPKIKGEKPRTHQAQLIDVKEIEKKCEHAPIMHGGLIGYKCKHCGVELQATWMEKK